MANIYKLIDISEDPLYVEGKLEGYLEKEIYGVKSLIINTDFNDERIALIMAVTIELVEKLRDELFENKLIDLFKKDIGQSKSSL